MITCIYRILILSYTKGQPRVPWPAIQYIHTLDPHTFSKDSFTKNSLQQCLYRLTYNICDVMMLLTTTRYV